MVFIHDMIFYLLRQKIRATEKFFGLPDFQELVARMANEQFYRVRNTVDRERN